MAKLKKCLLLFLLLLISVAANAQTISLKQLINRVEKNAPTLITDSSAIRIRQAQANETSSNWLPNLRLNYQADIGTSNNLTGPYFGFGVIPSSSGGIHASNITTSLATNLGIISFDWEVYNFGAYGAQNKVANQDIQIARNNFENSRYQFDAFAINNYLAILSLQNYLTIQTRAIKREQEILQSVGSLTRAGVRPGVDTSIANAELSKARLNYIELNNQLQQVQLQLSAVSGLPYQSIIADTLLENQLLLLPIQSFSADTTGHPLIKFYQSIVDESKLREELVKKQYNPKISIEAAAWGRGSSIDPEGAYGPLSSGLGFQRDNYLVGLGLSYNLFDLRRRQLKLRTQKAETDYAQNQLQEQKQLLANGTNQALVELQTARQRLVEIPKQLKAASEGYRQKLSLYRNGLTDIIELDAALNILYRAETDFARAKYDFTKALFAQAIADNQTALVLNLLK